MAHRSHIINAFALTVFICLFGATRTKSLPISNEKALEFLLHNGYADSYGERTQLTDQEVEEAFKKLQDFYSLPKTGVLDDATQKVIDGARCGVSDLRTPRYVTQGKWTKDIRFRLNYTAWAYDYASGMMYSSIHEWASRMNLGIYPSTDQDAEMVFNFVMPDANGYHWDSVPFQPNELAHAYLPGPAALSGDVHVNLLATNSSFYEPTWQEKKYSMKRVLTHEVGHALGLGHSSNPYSVMYPTFSSGKPYVGLQTDDIQGIQALYGARSFGINGGALSTTFHLITMAAAFILTILIY